MIMYPCIHIGFWNYCIDVVSVVAYVNTCNSMIVSFIEFKEIVIVYKKRHFNLKIEPEIDLWITHFKMQMLSLDVFNL